LYFTSTIIDSIMMPEKNIFAIEHRTALLEFYSAFKDTNKENEITKHSKNPSEQVDYTGLL